MSAVRYLWIVLAVVSQVLLVAQERKPSLTIGQVESLLRDLPDERLAAEIASRGIASPVAQVDVQRLRLMGAGRRTIEALSALLLPGRLTVSVSPAQSGVTVGVNGQRVLTNEKGIAVFEALMPGPYLIEAEKPPAYPRVEFQALVTSGGSQAQIALAVAAGKLTITTDKPNAQVAIKGVGTFALPANDLVVPAGKQSIEITAPQHLPSVAEIDVLPGQTTVLRPSLDIDRVAMARYVNENSERLVADLRRAFDRGDSDDYRASARPLIDHAVGTVFEIGLLHHHSGSFHDARLILDRSGMSFEPVGPCTRKAGAIPWNKVTKVEVESQGESGFLLRFDLADRNRLNFAVVGSTFGQETETKSLSVGRVGLGRMRSTGTKVRSPRGAMNTLQGLLWLASELRAADRSQR